MIFTIWNARAILEKAECITMDAAVPYKANTNWNQPEFPVKPDSRSKLPKKLNDQDLQKQEQQCCSTQK